MGCKESDRTEQLTLFNTSPPQPPPCWILVDQWVVSGFTCAAVELSWVPPPSESTIPWDAATVAISQMGKWRLREQHLTEAEDEREAGLGANPSHLVTTVGHC